MDTGLFKGFGMSSGEIINATDEEEIVENVNATVEKVNEPATMPAVEVAEAPKEETTVVEAAKKRGPGRPKLAPEDRKPRKSRRRVKDPPEDPPEDPPTSDLPDAGNTAAAVVDLAKKQKAGKAGAQQSLWSPRFLGRS